MGIAPLGLLFFANAGLHNALAEGARHATLFPRPTPEQVRTRIVRTLTFSLAGRPFSR